MTQRRAHAVVMGASLTGLGTARALHNHFERVTLVERDTLPSSVQRDSRKGVPQGNHGHALLAAGQSVLDAYFPGLLDELVALGANRGDATADFLFYQFGAWKLRTRLGYEGVVVSRPCLETTVREHLRRLPRVTFLEDHDVLEPVYDGAQRRVIGVDVKDRKSGATQRLDADFVIDCTGRGSISPRWLVSWGFPEVEEAQVKCEVGYTTGNFERRPDDWFGALGGLVIGTPPESKRGGGVFAVEGKRWVVTLGCWLRDYPPSDLEGYREFARSLPTPHVYDIVKGREPLWPLVTYRFPSSRRRYFERMSRFPAGYLVSGDAVCSFNPLYGQGMTVGLLEAKALDACLAEGDDRLAQRFYARARPTIDGAWSIATGEDMRFPTVEGKRPPGFALLNRYMEGVHRAATKDPVVLRRFYEVAGLLRPATAMLAPSVAWRVLVGGVGNAPDSPATVR